MAEMQKTLEPFAEKPETVYVLNIPQGEFFRYTKKSTTDIGYNRILRELLSKSAINILHLFSLKTPINGCFHQRKVTLPCAL